MNKISHETKRIYLNAIKTILTKENWKIFREKYIGDDNMILRTLTVYHHKFNRDKTKLNEWIKNLQKEEIPEIAKTINRAIELHEKAIEKLEKIKTTIIDTQIYTKR